MILIQRKLKLGVRSASKHVFILSCIFPTFLSLSLVFFPSFLIKRFDKGLNIRLNGTRIDTTLITKIQQVVRIGNCFLRILFLKKFSARMKAYIIISTRYIIKFYHGL